MKNTSKFSVSLILLYCLSLLTAGCCLAGAQNKSLSSSRTVFDIGVVLDLRTLLGKMSESCISMALADFYTAHTNYTTQLKLHWRDSNQDNVDTASMALDLLNNVQVKAILGPQTSSLVQFIAELGTKANVPILSFSSTSPLLSTIQTPYFIQTAVSDSSQVKAIAAVVKAFEWREVVQVCEDNPNGNGVTPYLIDALQEVEARVPYRCVLSHLMTDDQIAKELYKMKTMQTRVFIVHLSPSLSSRLFLMANEIGMMSEGYAWIITYGLANLLDSMNSSVIQSMQGVLGVKPYFPNSRELDNFTVRWKRKFFNENPNFDRVELNIFGIWAYDTVWALAKAVEKVQKTRLGVSAMGPKLRDAILKTNFNGLSGQFNLNNGQLQSSAFEIVNVIGKGDRVVGFWTPIQEHNNKKLNASKKTFSNSKDDLSPIIWPGDSTSVPKGWVIPTSGKKLKIGVPKMNGFPEFLNQVLDPETNQTKFKGYSIEVFQAAVERLPYAIEYEFFVFQDGDGKPKGSYNDLIDQVYFKNYDAVVGDVAIIANRTRFVDFTLPYTESGVMMLVLAKEDKGKAWIFLKPLRLDLWLMTGFFFLFTGFVVWILEHRVNDEFRGPPYHQIGVMLWFSLSTLVFAHRERLVQSRSKFVVIVWVFVVWILSSSYTASLTSLLTIQQLQPTISKVDDLVRNGDNVGYMLGSYVFDLLKSFKVEESKLKPYTSAEEYAEALSSGTVGAIVDEIPYIRLFLAKNGNCEKYKMVGPIYHTAGFGFVFPKGSPLVPELSREILYVTEGGIMDINHANWMGQQTTCGDKPTTAESNSLTLDSFWGLFLITGATSCLALFNYLLSFLYAHRHVLFTRNSDIPFHKRLIAIIRHLDEKDLSHHSFIRRARVSSGSLELVSRHRGNSPPTDASVELKPTSSNPTRRDWVVVTEVEDDTQHFQTINCAPLGGICSTERGGLEPDTPAPASTNIKAEIDLVDAERN